MSSDDSPVVDSLGEPAQHRMPVGQVGFLLGDVSLAVGQHVRQVFHKVVGLFFKDLLIKVAQVNQVTCGGGGNVWAPRKESGS